MQWNPLHFLFLQVLLQREGGGSSTSKPLTCQCILVIFVQGFFFTVSTNPGLAWCLHWLFTQKSDELLKWWSTKALQKAESYQCTQGGFCDPLPSDSFSSSTKLPLRHSYSLFPDHLGLSAATWLSSYVYVCQGLITTSSYHPHFRWTNVQRWPLFYPL